MTARYVRSGGNGGSWAVSAVPTVYATLAAALTAAAAGDDIYVSEDHVETQGLTMTLTPPGTVASPNRIICVNHSGSVPPVAADLRTTATVTVTGAAFIRIGNGFAYWYGLTLSSGSGNAGNQALELDQPGPWGYVFDTCVLKAGCTAGGAFNFGPSSDSTGALNLTLINTQLSFASSAQGINALVCRFVWKNTSSVPGVIGTIPANLFANNAPKGPSSAYVCGVDLSAVIGSLVIAPGGTGQNPLGDITFENCKLGVGCTLFSSGTFLYPGPTARIINCDSGSTNYKYHLSSYQGDIYSETTVIRAGGASDGTTPVSRKMMTTANSKIYCPLESDPIIFWNESTSPVTVTVPVITDNVTLTNADAWIEVEELGTAGSPLSVMQSSRAATILTAGVNCPADTSSTWAMTGLVKPVKQSLSVTFTPASKGPIRCRVMLAKPSTTMYFDPLIN